jgi:hypothetical protein
MKTIVISATKERDIQKTLLYQSLLPLKSKASFDFFFFTENSEGLSKIYNKALEKFTEYDAIVFIHDDVYLDDAFFTDKLEDGFSQFDIIGVAGGINPTLKAPTLWHIMCGQGNLRGAAGHFASNKEAIHITSFGVMPARVVLLDGVFLAVNRPKALKQGWKFNENYDFHLYDLASSLDANKKQLKCGVLPIHIIHQSPGLLDINNAVFVKNQNQFLKEYCS